MIVLVEQLETDPDEAEFTKNVIGKIIADHRDARLGRVRRRGRAALSAVRARMPYSVGSAISRIRATIWSASSCLIGTNSNMVSPRSAA
jgi:hypothetical protein